MMIWILTGLTLFFALSAILSALEDRPRGFLIHGMITFALLIATIIYYFSHRAHERETGREILAIYRR